MPLLRSFLVNILTFGSGVNARSLSRSRSPPPRPRSLSLPPRPLSLSLPLSPRSLYLYILYLSLRFRVLLRQVELTKDADSKKTEYGILSLDGDNLVFANKKPSAKKAKSWTTMKMTSIIDITVEQQHKSTGQEESTGRIVVRR